MKIIKLTKKSIKNNYNKWRYASVQKIFCVGKNKTGTTSLSIAFKQLGYKVAPQQPAESLIFDWSKNNRKPLVDFVKNSGQVFQDVPFSLDKTYQWMDLAFPNSKFILTIRDDAEQWYNSLVSFHSKLWANGNVPTKQDLQNASYRYKGYAWEAFRLINKTPENDLYKKEVLIKGYEAYNKQVMDYFKDSSNRLLVLNLKDSDATQKFSEFLELETPIDSFPWENKTSDIKTPKP